MVVQLMVNDTHRLMLTNYCAVLVTIKGNVILPILHSNSVDS